MNRYILLLLITPILTPMASQTMDKESRRQKLAADKRFKQSRHIWALANAAVQFKRTPSKEAKKKLAAKMQVQQENIVLHRKRSADKDQQPL